MNLKIKNKKIFTMIAVMMFIATCSMSCKAQENLEAWNIKYSKGTAENVNYTEVKDTIPFRGTQYMIRVPEHWNGILLSDLDYLQSANWDRNLLLLEQGYALLGTARRPERLFHYDPAHEIHDIISVLDIFEKLFGKPDHTIQLGCSGGGTISLAIAEIHPDRFDGSIAGCASTSPWMANTHLDALFVLKALIAPELPIVSLPMGGDELKVIGDQWKLAIEDAQKTAIGRAHIALAFTIGQWPVCHQAEADAYAQIQRSMYEDLLNLVPSERTFGTTMLEEASQGMLRWNRGVDYKVFFQNGNPEYIQVVNHLYAEANAEINKDLQTINAFERIDVDSSAIRWWSAPGRTHIGEPKIPLLRINTTGDALVYPSMAQGYGTLVKEKGYESMFRQAFVDRCGHCTFTTGEWMAAIQIMVERIETGCWPSTEPDDMNELGKKICPNSIMNYKHHEGIQRYNRIWCPSVSIFE